MMVVPSRPPNAAEGSPLRRMEAAIRAMFDAMNRGFFRTGFELEFMRPPETGANSVAGFLARFDAIFTLNQDLLLEIGYCQSAGPIPQALNPRWSGLEFPGMQTRVQPTPLSPAGAWVGSRCPTPGVQSVAASRRPFNCIFGGDTIERDKVLRFFGPQPTLPAQDYTDYRRDRFAERSRPT